MELGKNYNKLFQLVCEKDEQLLDKLSQIEPDISKKILSLIKAGKSFEYEDLTYCSAMRVSRNGMELWIKFKKNDRDFFLNVFPHGKYRDNKDVVIFSYNISDKDTIYHYDLNTDNVVSLNVSRQLLSVETGEEYEPKKTSTIALNDVELNFSM